MDCSHRVLEKLIMPIMTASYLRSYKMSTSMADFEESYYLLLLTSIYPSCCTAAVCYRPG